MIFSQSLVDRTPGDILEDTWVTVFGFPPAAASYILTQFTQLGTITEHQNPGSGNWMHLKYMVCCGTEQTHLTKPDIINSNSNFSIN